MHYGAIQWNGIARLHFDNPPGVITGLAEVVQDSVGRLTVEVSIERCDTGSEAAKKFGLLGFFGNPAGEGVIFSFGGENLGPNICKELMVECDDYVLRACGNLTFSSCLDDALNLQGKGKLIFSLNEACWMRRQPGQATYWSAPLLNFLSEYVQDAKEIAGHPLSPRDLTRCILFKYADSIGFVHALPDYDDSQKRLELCEETCLATARIAANVGSSNADPANAREWVPMQALNVLSFATGREVGLAWVDLWDAGGSHVGRCYLPISRPTFLRGRGVFIEPTHCGTGQLLSRALQKACLQKSYLTVVMNYLVNSGPFSGTIEDQLRLIFLALDMLCHKHVKKPDLKQMLGESEPAVRKLFACTAYELKHMRQCVCGEGNEMRREALDAIERYAGRWGSMRLGFGRAVEQLLKQFDLADAEIMNKYLKCHPLGGRKSFRDVLSYYRGIVMHEGFINFRSDDGDVQSIIALTYHLHDIAVRVVLKLLGHVGTYQPTMVSLPCTASLDWVRPDTHAYRLGYPETSN